jgi:hypothetical protein
MKTPLRLSAAHWRKSTYSGHDGGNCVEVASVGGNIAVRDSKDPEQPPVIFDPADWAALVETLKSST